MSPLSAQTTNWKWSIFLVFLPGQWIFSYFYKTNFYMIEPVHHLQVCLWGSGTGELFLLKFFQTEQREIWRQTHHITACCGKLSGYSAPFFVCCAGESWGHLEAWLEILLNSRAPTLELHFLSWDLPLANLGFVDPALKHIKTFLPVTPSLAQSWWSHKLARKLRVKTLYCCA